MDIGSFLVIAQLVVFLIPIIQQIVKAIEEAVTQAKETGTITSITGPEKKAAALSWLTQLWPTITKTGTGAKLADQVTPEQLTDLAGKMIDGAVSIFNSLRIFKKSTPADTR